MRWVTLLLVVACVPTRAHSGWTDGPPIPDPRWHHAAAASSDGYVMAFGGRVLVGATKAYNHGIGRYALAFFDPATHKWEKASPMPAYQVRVRVFPYSKVDVEKYRANGAAIDAPVELNASHADYELPFGGADANGRAHYFMGRGSVYFEPRTRAWGQRESGLYTVYSPDRRSNWYDGTQPSWTTRSQGATATGPDGKMYLVGGMGFPLPDTPGERRSTPGQRSLLDGLDIYDPETNTWKRGAPMKIARQSLAAAFGKDGKLYVFGGCGCRGSGTMYKVGDEAERQAARAEVQAQQRAVGETEVYDPGTDTWSMAAPMPTPRMLFAAATGADGKIYTIGGQTSWGGLAVAVVQVYDPATNRWQHGPSLRRGRVGHAAAVTGDGTIWVLGGYARAPAIFELSRLMAGEEEGPTASVELLKTKPE